MTNRESDRLEDEEFAEFLQGKGELVRHLRALPQPRPSALLDAAILAEVEAGLARGAACLPESGHHVANDAAYDASRPATAAPPGFMARWRMPMATAASMILAASLLLERQASTPRAPLDTLPETADAMSRPPVAATAMAPALPALAPAPAPFIPARKITPTAPASEADGAQRVAPPGMQVAQSDMLELWSKSAAPAPAAIGTASAPAPAARAPGSVPALDVDKAKAWLALIDEMLKADLHQDALNEWEKFRHAYPNYIIPKKFAAKMQALKK